MAALTPSGLQAALTVSGLQAALTVSGAVNGDVFAAYLDQVLGPALRPGDVVVPDNLPAHRVAGLTELVEARGARLLYLPPSSPNSNPINWPSASSEPGCAWHKPVPERPWKASSKTPPVG